MSVYPATSRTYDNRGRFLPVTHDDVLGRGTLYILGDEQTDGSERLLLDADSGIATIEAREDGVWNLTEFQLSQSSLMLGRDTRISASGHNVLITDDEDEEEHIAVTQERFTTGTNPPESTLLDVQIVRNVVQSDNSLEQTLTDHETSIIASGVLLVTSLYIQSGATAASADVTIIFTIGVPPNDVVFYRENFPSSSFLADSELVFSLQPGYQFTAGKQINIFVESDVAFTLKYNAAGTSLWFAGDTQLQSTEDILTESLLLTIDAGIIFDNDGVLVRGNEVFA